MASDPAAIDACEETRQETPLEAQLASGACLRIFGEQVDQEDYLDELAMTTVATSRQATGSREAEDERDIDEATPIVDAADAPVIDIRIVDEVPFADDATRCPGKRWVTPNGSILVPTRRDFVALRRLNENHWQITRSDFDELDYDRALLKSIGLSRGILPLHASVAQLDGHGIAAIGRASSGKTSALLSLIAEGADWLTDDDADYLISAGVVRAYPCPIGAKWRYLREVRSLLRNVRMRDRLRMRWHRMIRSLARQLRYCPLPAKAVQKLKRVSEGESRLWIDFPNRIAETQIDTVIFVIPGVQSEIRKAEPEDVGSSIAAVLWSELEPIHTLDKLAADHSVPRLFETDIASLDRVREATRLLLKEKPIFVITRSPRTSMRQMKRLLAPIVEHAYSDASSAIATHDHEASHD